jgi:hypothetical protein
MTSQMTVNLNLVPSWCLVIGTLFVITEEDVEIL